MFHTTIFAVPFFLPFFFFVTPTSRRPPSFPTPPHPSPSLSPVSLSSNKAAISNWNSMLSRSAHLIYKIKLKASHARMAFCSDEGKEEGNPFQLHTIIFPSCDLPVPCGDTFFLSPAMMCQMAHLKP